MNTRVYSPDGTRLVSVSTDYAVCIWNPETGHLLSTLNGHEGNVSSVAYSFEGSRIVSGFPNNTILIWDAQNNQIVCSLITGYKNVVTSVCFSSDGMLSGSGDNTVRVWDASTAQSLFPLLSCHTDDIYSICFFPDVRHFATGSLDGAITIWTLETILNDTN